MNQETITLQEVINKIDALEICDVEYVTCDLKRGTGGKIAVLSKVLKHTKQVLPKAKIKQLRDEVPGIKTNPNHKYHMTRNFYQQDTREIRKVHLRLITTFNGKRVL